MKFDFSKIKVLVIGDFMIDHYIIGTSNRVSPEAPVPVVLPQKEYSIPGGWECCSKFKIYWSQCIMFGYCG